jgi:AraC family transcriptional regulator
VLCVRVLNGSNVPEHCSDAGLAVTSPALPSVPPPGSRYLGEGTYFGRVSARLECAGLAMTEVHHMGAVRLPQHAHEASYFCLLLAGSYRETFGRTTLSYRPYTLGIHPAELVHHDEIGETGGRFFTVEISACRLAAIREGAPPVFLGPGEVRDATTVGMMIRLHRLYCRMLVTGIAPDALEVDSAGLELLAASERTQNTAERRHPRWLSVVRDMLHDGGAEPVSATVLASQAGVHPAHLARVFRRTHGCTMAQYQSRVRIQRACVRLASRGASLAHVAAEVGFADQSHFTRTFTAIVGIPPGAYRRLAGPRAGPGTDS